MRRLILPNFYVLALFLVGPVLVYRFSDSGSVGFIDLAAPIALILYSISNKPQPNILYRLYTLYLGSAILSSILSIVTFTSISVSDFTFIRLLFIGVPLIIVLGARGVDREYLDRCLTCFMFGGAIAIIISLGLYIFAVEIRDGQQRIWVDGQSYLRAGGLLGNTGDFGHLCATWGLAALYTISLSAKKSKMRFLLTLSVILLAVYSAYVSSSRAAIIHLIVGYIIVLPIYVKPKRLFLYIPSLAVMAVVSFYGVSELVFDPQFEKTLSRFDIFNLSGGSSFWQTARFSYWSEISSIINENIMIGVGYKNLYDVYGVYSDNSFIGVLVELGAIPFVLYLCFWLYLLFFSIMMYKVRSVESVFLFSMVATEILHALTLDTYSNWYSSPFSLGVICILVMKINLARGAVSESSTA